MSDDKAMIAEATARIFADLADPQSVNAATDQNWRTALWRALEEAGLTLAWLSEAQDGAGLALDDGFEILRVAGHYACPVALAETMLGAWILGQAGVDVPGGMLAVVPVRRRDRVDITCDGGVQVTARSVPHGAEAGHLVAVSGDKVALIDAAQLTAEPLTTDLGAERARIMVAGPAAAIGEFSGADSALETMGATARACQMTGALESILAITTDYTDEREAFGRKIAKFQAVQQSLAQLAGEVAAAITASGSAADTLATCALDEAATFLEVAAAKIRVGEAAETGAAIAHQAHGAIGWTQDYVLQRYTRSLFGWRDDFGAEADWAVRLGRMMAREGGAHILPTLTTR